MKNKIILASAIASLLVSSLSFAADNEIKHGRLEINGIVTSGSCKVSVNEGGKEGVVTLPDIHTKELANHSAVKRTTFDIILSNCIPAESSKDGKGKISIAWTDAQLADSSKGYLDNIQKDSAAKNIYLSMFNKGSETAIIPGETNETNTQSKALSNNKVKFSYEVGYITPDKTSAKPGLVQSKAVYVVSYE